MTKVAVEEELRHTQPWKKSCDKRSRGRRVYNRIEESATKEESHERRRNEKIRVQWLKRIDRLVMGKQSIE